MIMLAIAADGVDGREGFSGLRAVDDPLRGRPGRGGPAQRDALTAVVLGVVRLERKAVCRGREHAEEENDEPGCGFHAGAFLRVYDRLEFDGTVRPGSRAVKP